MSVIDFRFEEENVICEVKPDIDEDKVEELMDSMTSYIDSLNEEEYQYEGKTPLEITDTVMSQSGLEYRIVESDYCIFVE
jgi:hypothetical protein